MKTIYIVSKDINVEKVKKLFAHSNFVRWIYFAKDYRLMQQFIEELDKKYSIIIITDILNLVADEIREEHVEWIDNLNRAKGFELSWWFGVVSSRNVHLSNLFLYSCYLIVLQRIWKNMGIRPDLIVVDSPGLAKCVEYWIKTNSNDVKIRKVLSKKRFLKIINRYIHYVISLTIIVMRYLSAIFTKIGPVSKIDGEPRVVIDTFIHNDSFSNDGAFIDRYFPFLYKFLESKGYKILVHPVLYRIGYHYITIFRKMRKSFTKFIIQEDYLRWSDYVAAFSAPFKLRRTKIEHKQFRNIDFSSVLQEEHLSQHPALVMQAMLTYRLWDRLRESDIKLSQVINWYENQITDRALIAGIHKAYPGIKIMGLQSFIHIPNYLSLYPSQAEWEAGFTPDVLLQTGPIQCKTVLKYTHSIPCKAVAALRYDHLYKNTFDALCPSTFEKSIAVLLPSFIDEVLEILDTIVDAMKEVPDEKEFLIKSHPDSGFSWKIIKAFGKKKWTNKFHIWDGNLSDLLKKSAVIIASNSSSMVEAAVLGIPVIFIRRQSNLNMNPLEEIPFARFMPCDNGAQLAKAIRHYRKVSQEERERLILNGLLIRKQCFTEVSENTMSNVLHCGEATCS